MAAKEESLVLKYLKKNPASDALDISFGTDIDESVVKETLQQLLANRQVAEKVSESGASTWAIATAPARSSASNPAKVASESFGTANSDDDSSGGTGKGFVLFIALLTAIISVGASYFVGTTKIAEAKAVFDLELKNATDSVGFYKIETNKKIDALEQELKKLQTVPVVEPAPEVKAPTKAVKKSKKKKR